MRPLLPVAEALARVLALARPVSESIEVPLLEAFGLVLAKDIISTEDVPPLDNSAMELYLDVVLVTPGSQYSRVV